ncbi:peptidase domain-containing ABC transporter [Peijinzhouia sedimentorum]
MDNNFKKTISPTERFWRLLKPDRKEIRDVYIYSIFNGLVYLVIPLGIQAIINLIQGGRVSTAWIILVILVVFGIALIGIFQIFQLRITENLEQRIFTRASFEFVYRIPKIKMEELYKHYAPELMNRFFDTLTVQKGLSKILIEFSIASLQILFGLILLSFYNSFFIIFGLILVLLVFAIFRFTARRGLETSLEESKHKYRLVHWLEEVARTSNTFRMASNSDLALNKANSHVGAYLNARESHFKVLVQQYSMLVIFRVLVATGLLAIGGYLVMDQQLNIGQFVAAEIIILMIISSVEKLVFNLETIYDVLTALEKIGQVTDLELEKHKGMDLNHELNGTGIDIELDKVSFTYPGQDVQVLNDVNLKIAGGEKWLITGENASGKSTLIYLIAGLYNLKKGRFSVNDIPIENFNMLSYRALIGTCLSSEQLFEGTVLENIQVGREDASFENVKWAVKNLNLLDYVKSLPKGYDTQLDPLGNKLPKSIIQKFLIARSIVTKPRLLLLEDAFEYLDEEDKRKIIDFLFLDEHLWTLIATSSDQYMAKLADNIAIMNNGMIQRTGSYQELKPFFNSKGGDHA